MSNPESSASDETADNQEGTDKTAEELHRNQNKRKSHKFFDKISDRLHNPASKGLEVIAPPHLKSTVGSGVFEEVCVCVFAAVCVNPVSVSTNLSLLPV